LAGTASDGDGGGEQTGGEGRRSFGHEIIFRQAHQRATKSSAEPAGPEAAGRLSTTARAAASSLGARWSKE
jgi:hypothetical protein